MGPFSLNKPNNEGAPGPPCNQSNSGALVSPFCVQKYHVDSGYCG